LVPAGAEGEAWRGWGWRGFVDGRHFISLSDRFWFLVSRFSFLTHRAILVFR
jgi:hypothetical protein